MTEAGPVLSKNEPFRRKIIKIYDYVCKRNLHPTPQRLVRQDGSGLILIPGNMLTPNNYLNNAHYFRQDSSFLYYFGLNTPALVGLIDADSGEVALYGDDFTVEDIIWTGPQPSLREQGAEAGVSNTFPLADLKTHLTKAIVQGRRIHYLPPYRAKPSCCSPTCWDSNRPHCTITSRSS